MSLLSPEKALLAIDQTGWRLVSKGLRQHDNWPTLLSGVDSLSGALSQLELQLSPKRITVILDHEWARCQLVRIPVELHKTTEKEIYLKTVFQDMQGFDSSTWKISAQQTLPGDPAFACAIEQATLDALEKFARRQGKQLTNIQPRFVAVWNNYYTQMNVPNGALAMLAHGRISVGVWQDGLWLAFHTQRITTPGGTELASILQLMLAGHGYSAKSGVLHVIGIPTNFQLPELSGWTCSHLKTNGEVI